MSVWVKSVLEILIWKNILLPEKTSAKKLSNIHSSQYIKMIMKNLAFYPEITADSRNFCTWTLMRQ